MTDIEKKSEEYVTKKLCVNSNELHSCKVNCLKSIDIYIAYKDGYEQGQKDLIKPFDLERQEIIVDKNYLSQLEKEGEELKSKIKPLEDRICELRRKNASLENKVEKMKCCGNCKYIEEDGNYCNAYRQDKYFIEQCSRWELKNDLHI